MKPRAHTTPCLDAQERNHVTNTSLALPAAKRLWLRHRILWPLCLFLFFVMLITSPRGIAANSNRQHWAFRPLDEHNALASQGNPIDSYFQSSSPQASRHQLLRRLAFDLIGLPPSVDDIAAFNADPLPNAYEQLVDRLLADPRYGERWARHWLDVARYADSDGYESDLDRHHAWPYRDWVIQAFNEDLPFATFVKWQLAGDEYAPANPSAVIATGFLAAGPWQTTTPADTKENKRKIRYDELDDMLATTSAAFLGLTLGCARCHDHKFDPLPTRDYYQMLAAFTTTERGNVSLFKPRREFLKWKEVKRLEWREWKMTELNLTDDQKFWLRQPEHFYVPISVELFKEFGEQLKVTDADLRTWLPPAQQKTWTQLDNAASQKSQTLPTDLALAILDQQQNPATEYLLNRGDVLDRKEPVSLGFLRVLSRGVSAEGYRNRFQPNRIHSEIDAKGFIRPPTTYQRAAMAEWLTDVDQGAGPLLARVIVNRVWQYHFGEGFTSTPNDFGFQGSPPKHPELLEALAISLVRDGWKLKSLHKTILMSQAYRANTGPYRTPYRLEAEVIRDAMLAVSGRLNPTMYGAPYKPVIPKEAIATRSKDDYPTNIQETPELWRRSIYAFNKRSVPNPMMEVFDAPNPGTSCGRRNRTTVPTQALTLMNSEFVRDLAGEFAKHVAQEVGVDPLTQIHYAYLRALGRPPKSSEQFEILEFLQAANQDVPDSIPMNGLIDLCHLLFTLNEFAYVD